jgi:hypothetical protein
VFLAAAQVAQQSGVRWGEAELHPVIIPATLAIENGIWFHACRGIQGLLVQNEAGLDVVHMLCWPLLLAVLMAAISPVTSPAPTVKMVGTSHPSRASTASRGLRRGRAWRGASTDEKTEMRTRVAPFAS